MNNIEEIEQVLEDTEVRQKNKMLEGAFWSTIADFTSRLLGLIYIIPWYSWMGKNGDNANALFSMGYTIYAIFLQISTAGMNLGIAKEVAKYNTLGDENQSYRIVRQMLIFMTGAGLIFAGGMYIVSPALAAMSGGGQDLVPVLRSLAPAVFIFPSMSVIRGFFQGNNYVKPNALSQLAEQLIRVIWMLVTAFLIMKLGSGNYPEAVTQGTFAAFVGMIASYAVLIYFLYKTGALSKIISPGPGKLEISSKDLLVSTVTQAIPFVILGSATQIFKLLDQFTFSNVMTRIGNYTLNEVQVFFSYFSANPDKLNAILLSIVISLSGISVPLLTENYVKGDMKSAARLVGDNIILGAAFIIPSIAGITILAQPLYTFFYRVPSRLALNSFVLAVMLTIVISLFGMLTPNLQALRHSRFALKYFGITVLLKLILQFPAIYFFESYGPNIASGLAYGFGATIYLIKLQEITHFNVATILRRLSGILTLTIIMAVVTAVMFLLLKLFIVPNTKLKSLIIIVLAGGTGFATYFYLIMKSKMIDILLGDKGVSLRRRFKIN
ncbi:polysaccharide biosynthesis protein [Floricoccus penangensis]|uniref:Polysaccharide biosynthesis protein n=1 Tax=Floricoccus penangensis TaxID=1859475 RepID=A0A9Q5NZG9_9LACT|nr:polysaccharide biosynthesis protein [Floricoccus penangensis]OFI46471.1 polysaccharide biosynthesis protein [Floricoccus penangensis]